DLALEAVVEEIGHGVDAVDAAEKAIEHGRIAHVAFDELDALSGEPLRAGALGVARQPANRPPVSFQMTRGRAALGPGDSRNRHDRHGLHDSALLNLVKSSTQARAETTEPLYCAHAISVRRRARVQRRVRGPSRGAAAGSEHRREPQRESSDRTDGP